MSEELDEIGQQTAAMMKTMLQIATLVALKTRERGQKEAEARVKVTEAKIKETREAQNREAREAKAKDPRNKQLSQMIQRPAPERPTLERLTPEKAAPTQGLSLGEHTAPAQEQLTEQVLGGTQPEVDEALGAVAQATASAPRKPAIHYDSPERRAALEAHLSKLGIAPEIASVRMFMEIGQAKSPTTPIRTHPDHQREAVAQRERERERGLDRSR